jgi:hypothetical protein
VLWNGNKCGEKTKVFPIQIMIDQKEPENVGYFDYLGSMVTSDLRCTLDIKARIAMEK